MYWIERRTVYAKTPYWKHARYVQGIAKNVSVAETE